VGGGVRPPAVSTSEAQEDTSDASDVAVAAAASSPLANLAVLEVSRRAIDATDTLTTGAGGAPAEAPFLELLFFTEGFVADDGSGGGGSGGAAAVEVHFAAIALCREATRLFSLRRALHAPHKSIPQLQWKYSCPGATRVRGGLTLTPHSSQ
jgi:hypothetical protein